MKFLQNEKPLSLRNFHVLQEDSQNTQGSLFSRNISPSECFENLPYNEPYLGCFFLILVM